jgi:hypothetical protein
MALIGRLTLTDGTSVLAGTHDPSSTATTAQVGSLYFRVSTPYGVYQKIGTGGTDWVLRGEVGSSAVQAQVGGGVTTTIDLSTGRNRQLTTNSATTAIALTNPTPGVYELVIIQGGAGQVVTWPGTVKWAGAVAPTLSIAPGAKDYFRLYYDGSVYFGEQVGLAYA